MPPAVTIPVPTRTHAALVDITEQVRAAVRASGVRSGLCCVFNPHTTAGLTINENADPDVVTDILKKMDSLIPWREGYRHGEGNSAAHIKASLFGPALTLLIEDGTLLLGTWQGIYFCEFDGPRQRHVLVKIIPEE
jgi:secondary thiamine-phosphate synthase enzyme